MIACTILAIHRRKLSSLPLWNSSIELSLVRQQTSLCLNAVFAKHFGKRPLVLPVAMIDSSHMQMFADFAINHFYHTIGTEVVQDDGIGIRVPKYLSSFLTTPHVHPINCMLDTSHLVRHSTTRRSYWVKLIEFWCCEKDCLSSLSFTFSSSDQTCFNNEVEVEIEPTWWTYSTHSWRISTLSCKVGSTLFSSEWRWTSRKYRIVAWQCWNLCSLIPVYIWSTQSCGIILGEHLSPINFSVNFSEEITMTKNSRHLFEKKNVTHVSASISDLNISSPVVIGNELMCWMSGSLFPLLEFSPTKTGPHCNLCSLLPPYNWSNHSCVLQSLTSTRKAPRNETGRTTFSIQFRPTLNIYRKESVQHWKWRWTRLLLECPWICRDKSLTTRWCVWSRANSSTYFSTPLQITTHDCVPSFTIKSNVISPP